MDARQEIDLLDMQSREWREGSRPELEKWIETHPRLREDADLLLDLIYNEVLLREEQGDLARAEDYVARFPHLKPQLLRQFEVHQALESSGQQQDSRTGATRAMAPEKIFAGRYESMKYHKEGGLGFVFLAHDRELNRAVALKCMKRTGAADEPLVKRFLQEAEITSRLEHPSIVPVHGSGVTEDGRPYYAMRFVDGDTLEAACKRLHATDEPFQEHSAEFRRLLRALIQVCDAVAYAHSKGVIHRDLKPSNVMLGTYGEALVLDWGLAKPLNLPEIDIVEEQPANAAENDDTLANFSAGSETPPTDLTITGKAKGSPAFMSPEQARGDWDQVGTASDVYSLGATLYYLLTGALAFSATTSQGVLKQVGAGEFQPPRSFNSRVPAALSAITCKAMALRPAERYATPQELGRELERWIADEPVMAHADSWTIRAGRWARRHRTLVATCLVGLVVAALALAVGAWRVGVANRALSIANENESKQRALANQRFSDALDDQVRLVTEMQSELSKAAGTRGMRERLVNEAMAKLQKLIEGATQIEEAEMALAKAHLALAMLYEEVDFDLAKAESEATIAASQAEALQKKQPQADAIREFRFDCLLRQFYILIARGKVPDASAKLKSIEEQLPSEKAKRDPALARVGFAKARLAQTLGDHPRAIRELDRVREFWQAQASSSERREQLSVALSQIGELKYLSGQSGEAVNELASALALERELIEQDLANILYQLRAAAICDDLGLAEIARNRHAEAEKYLSESVRLSETILAKDPDNTAAKLQLADAQFGLAELVEDRGKLNASLTLISAARKISEDLVKHDARSIEGRAKLAHYLLCEGRIRRTQGKNAEAAAAFDQAAKMQKELLVLAPQYVQPHVHLSEILRLAAELRLENLQDDSGGFQAFADAQMELNRLAKIDSFNIQWQSARIGNLVNVARWKQLRMAPGIEDLVAAGMREIDALPENLQQSPPILDHIASFRSLLADAYIAQRKLEQADKILAGELAALEDLKVNLPGEAFVWRQLRTLYGQSAVVHGARKDVEGELHALNKSVEAGRELEMRFPDYDRQNQHLAKRLELLADKLVYTQPLEALKLLEEAITRYDEIVPEVAARFRFQFELGVKRLKAADLSDLQSGDPEATILRYRSAAEHFSHCVSDDPQETALAASYQSWSLCSLCERLLRSGRIDEAKKVETQLNQVIAANDIKRMEQFPLGRDIVEWRNDYQGLFEKLPAAAQSHEAIEMLPKVQRLLALQSRVGMLASQGKLDEAAETIDWLAENGDGGSGIYYKAAKMSGMLFAASKPPETKYRDRAIELLQAAIDRGFFTEPGNKPQAQLEPEFRAFSETPEFKKLFDE